MLCDWTIHFSLVSKWPASSSHNAPHRDGEGEGACLAVRKIDNTQPMTKPHNCREREEEREGEREGDGERESEKKTAKKKRCNYIFQ